MVSKVNILGKEENARESHIKGNRIYQGRKLQGISGKEKGTGRTQETQGKKERRKKDSRKEGMKDRRKQNGSRKDLSDRKNHNGSTTAKSKLASKERKTRQRNGS